MKRGLHRKRAKLGSRVRLVVEYNGGAFDEQGVIQQIDRFVQRGKSKCYHVRIAGIDFVLRRSQFEVL